MAKEISVKPNMVAIVDDEDFDRVKDCKWYAITGGGKNPKFYPATYKLLNGKIKWKRMHRFLFEPNPPEFVDHKDGNPFNNTRSNLRSCTKQQNQCNQNIRNQKSKSSRFKGVHWNSARNGWVAQIKDHRKLRRIGVFSSEIEAAKAYDSAALEFHGEFARTNKCIGLL